MDGAVVDGRTHAALAEPVEHPIAQPSGDEHGEKVVRRSPRPRQEIDIGAPTQRALVAEHDGFAPIAPPPKTVDLRNEERGFDVGHRRLVAELDHVPVDVASAVAQRRILRDAVVAKPAQPLCERRVARHDGAAVARGHRFGRVKTEDGQVAQIADSHTVLLCFDGVRRVFDERDAVPIADRAKRFHVGELAVEVNRDHRPRALRERGFHGARIDEPGLRIDVGEDGGRAMEERRVRRGDEGHRRRDDFVAGTHAEGLEREHESHRAARDAHDLFFAEEFAECPLENADLGAERQKQGLQRLGDGRDLGIAEVVSEKLHAFHRTFVRKEPGHPWRRR